MSDHPRTVLVTGASSGIGVAFAEVFAEHGFELVITARREDRLREVAARLERTYSRRVHVIASDLSRPDAPAQLCQEIASRGVTIDALVNNAGYGVPGTYVASPWERHDAMLHVMVTAVAELTYRLLPGMIERRYGRIITVASLAGLVPAPAGHTLYAATKAFAIKFSEALAHEGRPHGVHVTAVCPGFTLSEFHDVTGTRAQVSKLPVMDVDGCSDRRAPGFRCGDGRDAHLHQRTRQSRDRGVRPPSAATDRDVGWTTAGKVVSEDVTGQRSKA